MGLTAPSPRTVRTVVPSSSDVPADTAHRRRRMRWRTRAGGLRVEATPDARRSRRRWTVPGAGVGGGSVRSTAVNAPAPVVPTHEDLQPLLEALKSIAT